MRKLFLAVPVIGILYILPAIWMQFQWFSSSPLRILVLIYPKWFFTKVTELRLRFDCGDANPTTPTCRVRMAAMGNLLSSEGELADGILWYERAGADGDPEMLFELGWSHEQLAVAAWQEGLRNHQDPPQAFQTQRQAALSAYRKSSDAGYAPARNNLGDLLSNGMGGPADYGQAFALFSAAAAAGNPIASWNLAIAYEAGRGTPRDEEASRKWSVWTPSVPLDRQLLWPVLDRTTISGNPVSPDRIQLIRAAWQQHMPVTMSIRRLQPDPRIPTFHRVEPHGQ